MLCVAVTAIFLLLTGRPRTAALVVLATASGAAIAGALKDIFARTRPDLIPHDLAISTHSFPSGHAMISAVVYLTLGSLIAESMSDQRLKSYVLAVSIFLPILVGLSRLYLGVHWPTDVLAGWAAGAAWAIVCWNASYRIVKREK
jgi:undecaprenyl-diphosphatase